MRASRRMAQRAAWFETAKTPPHHEGLSSSELGRRGYFFMQFDTKIAVMIRTDLEPWQKLNVASFLAGGIAAAFPECIGENYDDGSGTKYLSLIGQPILIYGADRPALSRALERALARTSSLRSIPRTCSKPRMTPPTARW